VSAPFVPSTDTHLDSRDLASMSSAVAAMLGAKCTVQHGTYNATSKTTGPPYVNYKTGVPVDVVTVPPTASPEMINYIRTIGIALNQYRLITLPVGTVVHINDRILIEPTAHAVDVRGQDSYTTNVYYVVLPENADETQPVELRLHCRLVEGAPI
jgi:hypothetical protein